MEMAFADKIKKSKLGFCPCQSVVSMRCHGVRRSGGWSGGEKLDELILRILQLLGQKRLPVSGEERADLGVVDGGKILEAGSEGQQ